MQCSNIAKKNNWGQIPINSDINSRIDNWGQINLARIADCAARET